MERILENSAECTVKSRKRNYEEKLTIKEARQFWQNRTPRELTDEDIREIDSNLIGFFEILLEWHEQDLQEQSKCLDCKIILS